MVAIVSGGALGLELGSLAVLGQNGAWGAAASGRGTDRVYVNAFSGNLVIQAEDELLAARGTDALALRTYNSQGLLNDDNADNWTSAFGRPLVLTGALNTAGSTIARTSRDGAVAVYAFDAGRNAYLSTEGDGAYDTITFVAADNQLQWRDGATGATQRYEAGGAFRLLAQRDTAGNALQFTYAADGHLASVRTASGETTFYDYVGNNLAQIRTVTADGVTSTRSRYSYDASNRLVMVTVDLTPDDNSVADGQVYRTTYTYDGSSTRVATLTQSDGSRLEFTYVQVGSGYRIASIKDGLNLTTSFTYNYPDPGGAGYTTVKDPQNFITRFDVDAAGRLVKVTGPTVTSGTPTRAFTYNANGDVASVTVGSDKTTFSYDARGNQVQQRDALGNTVTRTFDGDDRLLTESLYVTPAASSTSAPAGAMTTRHVYDAGGRGLLRFVVSAEGRVTEHRYNGFGERTATLAYLAGTYPVAGLAATSALTEASVAAWAGSQPAGQVQRADFEYDARGQLRFRTSYARVAANGDGIADGSQAREQFVYDQRGNLLQVISARNGTTVFTYDGLGRRLTERNALGELSVTQYDDAGRRTLVTLASGLVTTSTYDAGNRLVSVMQSGPGEAALGTTRYSYDASNRLRMTEDPTGVRSWMLYDAAGRKVADIDGNGTLTEYTYDARDLLVYIVTYQRRVAVTGLIASGGGPNLGVTLSAIRPALAEEDARTWRWYDSAGRLVKEAVSIDQATWESVTETRYDGASRVVEVIRYANRVDVRPPSAGQAPGSANQVPSVAPSAHDRRTRHFYDADGLHRGVLDAEGYLTVFHYTASGQLSERVAMATQTSSALRASGTLAQLMPDPSEDDIHFVILYDASGRVMAEVDGEGYLAEYVRDANGNATHTTRYATSVVRPVSATASLSTLRPAPSAADRVTVRSFDALNRLTQETSAEGVVTQYVYDAAGNLVSTTRAAGTSEVRTLLARFDVQGRLVGELSAEGAARLVGGQTQSEVDAVWAAYGTVHAYDAAGRRVSTTDALGHRTWFFYDEDSALTHTVNALGEVQQVRYDAQGRVVERIAHANRVATAGLVGGRVSFTAPAAHPLDHKVSYTYTRDGRVATATDALGHVTSYAYNAFGDESSRSEPAGSEGRVEHTYTYDRRGLRTGTVADAGAIEAITTTIYDAFGRVVRTVDANGNVRHQELDRLGRVVSTVDPTNALRSTTYDAFGGVLVQTDALGRETRYVYDAAERSLEVTSPEGIVTTTTYTRHGQVFSFSDGTGQLTTYTYDRNGDLTGTSTPLSTTGNAYDAARRLVETTDANGTKVAYTYDAAHRQLTRRVDPQGLNLLTSYGYDAKGQRVTVTDAAGLVTVIDFDAKGQVVRQTVDPTGVNLQTTFSYDAQGRTLSVRSAGGTLTEYRYDKLGRRVRETVDPTGLDIRRSWTFDKNGNVTSSTEGLASTTRYIHDAADRLLYAVGPTGAVTGYLYDADGRVVRTVTYAREIDPATLGAAPTAASVEARVVTDPLRDLVEHRVYDRDGRVVALVGGTGAVTRLTYDGNGRVLARVTYANRIDLASWVPGSVPVPVADNARDARQLAVYDALGRAIYQVDGAGAVVKQVYDGNGNVLSRIAYAKPIVVTTAITESAIAAAVVASSSDASVRNLYDAAGRLAWSADGTGAVTQRVYDRNGNVVRLVQFATAIAAGASPASAVAKAADRVTAMAYDGANRLVLEVDALRAVTENVYDGNGNVVRRVQYATPIGALPALGTAGSADAIRAALGPNAPGRTTRHGYDAAGRLVLTVDAMGAAVEMRRDAAGRVVARTAYSRAVALAALTPASTLADMRALLRQDASDRTTRLAYDAAGRLAYEVDATGAVTGHLYDGTGQVQRTTRYMERVQDAQALSASEIAARLAPSATRDQVDVFTWNAAGRQVTHSDALGSVETFSYDGIGNRLSFTNMKGFTWTYTYDAAGRMLSETTPVVALTATGRNGSGALVAGATVDAAVVTRMAYDALGNLVSRTEAAGRAGEERTTTYAYDAAGRQVKVTHAPGGVYRAATDTLLAASGLHARSESTETLTVLTFYDALGNAVANRDTADALSQKVYDLAGRVVYEVDAMGFVTGYVRNAFGEVTSLTRFGGSTTLAVRTVNAATEAVTRAQVDSVLSAGTFDHAADRKVQSIHDALGRVVETLEPTKIFVFDPTAPITSGMVERRTLNTYDAFGQLVEVRQRRNASEHWTSTAHFYDQAGREISTRDSLHYVTQREFDAAGNLVRQVEWANAAAPGWVPGMALPVASAEDRVTVYGYDRLNRKETEIRKAVEFSTAANGQSTVGDLVTTFGYDAVGNQTRVTDATGGVTYTYYDAIGRIAAVAAPTRNGPAGTPLTPLTTFMRDGHGNVVVKMDHARGAAAASLAGTLAVSAGADAADRVSATAYDVLGRIVQTTDAGLASRHFSYDKQGQVAKSWQAVTGHDGITRTLFELSTYDKLGQRVEATTPASNGAFEAGLTGTYLQGEAGAGVANRYGMEWSGLIDAAGGTVRVELDYMASAVDTYDPLTLAIVSTTPPQVRTTAQEFGAAVAAGGVEMVWQQATNALLAVRVKQWVNGAWQTKWQGTPDQATGSRIVTLTQAQAGLVRTQTEHNAFGEVVRRGTGGAWQEYFDYDTAGRVWRTNGGDGVDKIQLYDALGNLTSDIRSSGSGRTDIDLKVFTNVQIAAADLSTRRIDIGYDALGRVVSRVEAERQEQQGGVSVLRPLVTTAIEVRRNEGVVTGSRVDLGWSSLAGLGSGDIRVEIEYLTEFVVTVNEEMRNPMLPDSDGTVGVTGGQPGRYVAGTFADGPAGIAFEVPQHAIGEITRVLVFKKDLVGNWSLVIDQAPGYGSNAITVASPPNPDATLRFMLRPSGSVGDAGWIQLPMDRLGLVHRYDARGWAAGTFDYMLEVTTPGDSPRVTAWGSLHLSAPALGSIATPLTFGQAGAGVLSWQKPPADVQQVLRYRPSGSTGEWSNLTVSPRNTTLSGVDTSALEAGTYQFELLWKRASEGAFSSHATGTFTSVPPVPAYWVPPVNLPHITGLRLGTSVTGGTPVGDDENRLPITTGGTEVHALVWNAALAEMVRYRVSGGEWAHLAIDNSGQYSDALKPYGVQKSSIQGLAPGIYELQIVAGSPASAWATATLTVHGQSPGHYEAYVERVATYRPIIAYYEPVNETRVGTRTVAYEVWVNDPPRMVGRDENGNPIYEYPRHRETRYRQETYTYEVQVGQRPVYATDENGNVLHEKVWVNETRQRWVEGTTPVPTLVVTTPPYTPGYQVPKRAAQYTVSVTTAPGSVAISTTAGVTLAQAVGLNSGDRFVRAKVQQVNDRWGNVLQVSDPRNAAWKTTYRYNANDQLVQQVTPDDSDPAGAVPPVFYDESGQQVTPDDSVPRGAVTRVFYDQLGRQVAVMDARGNVEGREFDAGGNLVREIHADTGVVTHSYDAFSQRVGTTDAEGKSRFSVYDKVGNLLSVSKGEAYVFSVTASGAGTDIRHGNVLVTPSQKRMIVDSWTYDELGRKLTQTNGNGETVRYAYDLRGNLVETRQPLGQAVRAAYDAQGRKIAEVDANGFAALWSYDYFGLLIGHTDLGGAAFSYTYDQARQLTGQRSTRGQNIFYEYDAAGQLTRISDRALDQVTTYAYDLGGRRVHERVVQAGVVYQDSFLAYDKRGQLRDVADGRAHVHLSYDAAGNRTQITTRVGYMGASGAATHTEERYFRYDEMNRQVLVNAVSPGGAFDAQTHAITYDRNGNRKSDTSLGTTVTSGQLSIQSYNSYGVAVYAGSPGTAQFQKSATETMSVEEYRYDALGRLQSVVRDGVQIDVRQYDGADRVIKSGTEGNLPMRYADMINAGVPADEVNGKEMRVNRYDANGRLLHQRSFKSNGGNLMEVSWDANERFPMWTQNNGYDAAGNVRGYSVYNHVSGTIQSFSTSLRRFDGYQAGITEGSSSATRSGSLTQHYDANGFLVGVTDARKSGNNRTFVNDANGVALHVRQDGQVQRQMVVNGEVLGTYAAVRDGDSSGAPVDLDLDFVYAPVSANYPNASPGAYQARPGDTLQSIARSAYGDSALWYRIAEANGLEANDDLKVGQTLNIPSGVGTIHNNAGTFKPYDPSRIQGDMTPHLPMPGPDCGAVGKVLMVVVAAVVTAYAGPVAGSIASQLFGLGTGQVEEFSWTAVALAAVSGAVTGGLSNLVPAVATLPTMVQAAIGSATTQGIAVATGLQKRFDWRAVAASAVGAKLSEALGPRISNAFGDTAAGQIAARTVTGLAVGTAVAVTRGGRISISQVASDAFGNALGQSLADAATGDQRRAAEAVQLSDAVYGASDEASGLYTGPGLRYGAGGETGFQISGKTAVQWMSSVDRGVEAAAAATGADQPLERDVLYRPGADDPYAFFTATGGASQFDPLRYSGPGLDLQSRIDRGLESVAGWSKYVGEQFDSAILDAASSGKDGWGRFLTGARVVATASADAISGAAALGRLIVSPEARQAFAANVRSFLQDPAGNLSRAFDAWTSKAWHEQLEDVYKVFQGGAAGIGLAGKAKGLFAVRVLDEFASLGPNTQRVLSAYQNAYNDAAAAVWGDLAAGNITKPGGLNFNTWAGNRIDAVARDEMLTFKQINGIGDLIVNQRLYVPGGKKGYRIPDLMVPGERTIIDGTIGNKSLTTPQIQDFFASGKVDRVILVAPNKNPVIITLEQYLRSK